MPAEVRAAAAELEMMEMKITTVMMNMTNTKTWSSF